MIRRRLRQALRRVGPIVGLQDQPCNPETDPRFFATNEADAADVAGYGFRAIKIWPRVDLGSQDFAAVMQHPAFDVIVIRPLAGAVWDLSIGENYLHEVADFGECARQLYLLYGRQQKTVILSNCEADWQVGDCRYSWNYVPTQSEQDAFLALLNARQASIAWAREANQRKQLRVYHAVEVCRAGARTPFEVVRDIVPRMTAAPDYLAFSSWICDQGLSMSAALDYIEAHSGVERARTILGEVGRSARHGAQVQHDIVAGRIDEAFSWGARLAFVWMWQSRWDTLDPGCAMLHPETGQPTPVMGAAVEARERWDT